MERLTLLWWDRGTLGSLAGEPSMAQPHKHTNNDDDCNYPYKGAEEGPSQAYENSE